MEAIYFLKDLRKRGIAYSKTWFSILMEYNGEDRKVVRLSVMPDMPKSTYARIISLGLELFPKYIHSVSIEKNRSELIIQKLSKESIETVAEVANVVVEEKEPVKKVQKQPKAKPINNDEVIDEIINYLNECTGKSYKANSKIAITNINARLKEGYTLEDFKKVIFVKSTKWIGTKWEDYLTPNTLFGNKFESYRNENVIFEKSKQEQTYEQVIKATELGFNS